VLSEIKFTKKSLVLKQENKTSKDILSFVTKYEPSVPLSGVFHISSIETKTKEKKEK